MGGSGGGGIDEDAPGPVAGTAKFDVPSFGQDVFERAFDAAAVGMAIVSLDGTWLRVNERLCILLGQDAEELVGTSILDVTHPDDVEANVDRAQRLLAGEIEAYHLDKRYLHAGGFVVWARLSTSLVCDSTKKPLYLVAQIEDITQQRATGAALTEAEDRFRSAFQDAPIGMALVGLDGRWQQVNDSLCGILGYARAELVTKTFRDLTHPDNVEADAAARERLVAGEIDRHTLRKRYLHAAGHVVWADRSATLVRSRTGEPLYFVTQVVDVTEQKRAQDRIAALALQDPLTGLANRTVALDRIGHAQAAASRTGDHVGVIFIDLDGFKSVNDRHGHHVGDQVLTEIAHRLSGSLRPADTAARLGGDEFVICLSDLGRDSQDAREQVEVIAARVAAAVEQPIQLPGAPPTKVGASIGIAVSRAASEAPASIIRRADEAMYDSRRNAPAQYDGGRSSRPSRG